MSEFFLTASGCLILGIMTTMHPCPLATNISAISLLSGTSHGKKNQVLALLFFTMGYSFALIAIAVLINFGLVSIPMLSVYLQSILSAFLGPMLIFVGMVLSEMINFNQPFKVLLPGKEYWKNRPAFYTFILGALLALTFCPATAFIYFGIMIPLSVDNNQVFVFPLLYAVGALLPVATISVLINRGFVIALQEKWSKRIPLIAGWILILIGIYITLQQIYF